MKFAVVILACVAAASAQFNNNPYNPFGNQYNRYRPTPKPLQYRPFQAVTVAPTFAPKYAPTPAPLPVVRVAVSDARNAQTVKYGNEPATGDGSYAYYYETDNGIAAQEQGTPRNFGGNPPVIPVVAQGSYRYISPEGLPVEINYVADENGFQPSGNVLPTPPPVPPQIARALDYLAKYAPQK